MDCVRALSNNNFVTGSESGNLDLWSMSKKKPIFTLEKAHDNNWITSIGGAYNSDLIFSGAYNYKINGYKLDTEVHEI